jgi:lycopene beta-cyclase
VTGKVTVDVALVGGGLANVLIALRLAALKPDLSFVLLERGAALGGNHTWSFHDTDVSTGQLAWLKPLITAHWPTQEVRFPGLTRILETGYNSIDSERLHHVAMGAFADRVRLGADVRDVTPDRVTLADGTEISAACVIDGRGALREQPLALGYQKFVGHEIETTAPHGRTRPIIMDATVAQADGYRFVYTLPFTPTTIMVEDTYYSEGADLDEGALDRRVEAYIAAQGWAVKRLIRREAAVLPITLAGDIDAHWKALGRDLPRVGLRAWLFHPTTGYSLPFAVRMADLIAGMSDLRSRPLAAAIESYVRDQWGRQAIFRFLNRMLFLAARPNERVGVLERFYGLPADLIERFYAAELTFADRARILSGRPPLPLSRAVRFMGNGPAWDFAARQSVVATLG